jgi:hypothetical protein
MLVILPVTKMPSTFKTLILALLITFSFLAISKVADAEDVFCKDDFFENSKNFDDRQTFNAFAEQSPMQFISCFSIIGALISTMDENCRFLKANEFFNISDPNQLPKNADFETFLQEGSDYLEIMRGLSRKDILEIEGFAPRLAKLYPCEK